MSRVGVVVAFSAAVLVACATLPGLDRSQGKCYAIGSLNADQKAFLGVGAGAPLLLAGGSEIACTCWSNSALAGAGEQGRLGGAGEQGGLRGAGEQGGLRGAGESSGLKGAGEDATLAGGGESGKLAGGSEGSQLRGAGETDRLAGAGEQGGLRGAGEQAGPLAGASSLFNCKITSQCRGFSLEGFAAPEISVRSPNGGVTTMPSSCITW